MTPWLFEALVLAMIGLSGVAGGIVVGWRHPLLLAGGAVLISGTIRVFTSVSVWSAGFPTLIQAGWWWASGLLLITAGTWAVIRHRRELLTGFGFFAAFSAVGITVKYVLAWGERHHRDSTSVVETALMIFQSGLDPARWDPSVNRGLSYPLMLALGPDGRMLSAITPVILLSLAALAWWLATTIMAGRVPQRWHIVAGIIVGAFSLTVPIFRVSLTYLNAHTFMALGVLAMVAALVLLARNKALTPETIALLAFGGLIAATARVEGAITVAVLLSVLVSSRWISTARDRAAIVAIIVFPVVGLTWWLDAIESELPASLGLGTVVIVAGVAVAAIVVTSPLFDRIRHFIFPAVLVVVFALLIRIPLRSSDPVATVLAQFNNVVLGYGGWGVAATALGVSLVMLGWHSRSSEYRLLALLSVVLIFVTLFSKLFDGEGTLSGGFGRDGFYDSVNRMWLHTMGVVAVTMILGYAEFLFDFARRPRPSRRGTEPQPDYTANTVPLSKDSQS